MINTEIRKHVKPCKFLGFVIDTESFFKEFNGNDTEGRKKLSDAVLIFSRAMEIANFQVKRGICRDIEKRSDKLPNAVIHK